MTIQKTVAARLIPIIFFFSFSFLSFLFSLFFFFFFFPPPPERGREGGREIFGWRFLSGSGAGSAVRQFRARARARLFARLIARRALIAVCKLRGGRGARDTDSLPSSPHPLPPLLIDFLFYATRQRFMTPAFTTLQLRRSRIACAFIYAFVSFTSRRR